MPECKNCKRSVNDERQFIRLHCFKIGQIDEVLIFCSGICHSVFMLEETHDFTYIFKSLESSWFPVIRQLRDQLKRQITK